jgi:hypothetical protein
MPSLAPGAVVLAEVVATEGVDLVAIPVPARATVPVDVPVPDAVGVRAGGQHR